MDSDSLLPAATNGAIVAAGGATEDFIKSRIFTIRGVQVSRFMFQLSERESADLRS